jgi:hypothetical protein
MLINMPLPEDAVAELQPLYQAGLAGFKMPGSN